MGFNSILKNPLCIKRSNSYLKISFFVYKFFNYGTIHKL